MDSSYRNFMFDLCKEIYAKLKHKSICHVRKEDFLKKMEDEAKMVFGFDQRPIRERNTTKWTKKRRDVVDLIIKNEIYDEEEHWRNCEKEKLEIKNSISNFIFEKTLSSAVSALSSAFEKKINAQT